MKDAKEKEREMKGMGEEREEKQREERNGKKGEEWKNDDEKEE